MTRVTKGGRREDLDGKFFRSSWEANICRYLKFLIRHEEVIGWEYEMDEFEFPVKRGTRFYRPDFKVTTKNGSIEYWEVKGYMDKVSKTQLKRMQKYYPQVKIIVIDKDAYNAIKRDASHLIPHFE